MVDFILLLWVLLFGCVGNTKTLHCYHCINVFTSTFFQNGILFPLGVERYLVGAWCFLSQYEIYTWVITYQRRYDMVDLYSRVNANELLRLAFQACDQIAAFSLHAR